MRSPRRFVARMFALTLVVFLVAAACGDDDAATSDASTTSAGPADTTPGSASTEPYRIGGIALLTTPQGAEPFAGLVDGAKARIARLNREGGLMGRQVELVETIDDKGDPNADADAQSKLVSEDKVDAIVPIVTPGFVSHDLLDQKKVLHIGNGFAAGLCPSSDYGFSFSGCGSGNENLSMHIPKVMDNVIPTDQRTTSIICDDSAACQSALSQIDQPYERDGWKVCYSKAVLPVQVSDYSPFVKDMTTACDGKAPSVLTIASAYHSIGLTGAAKALGYKGTILNFVTHNAALLQSPDTAQILEGTYSMNFGVGCVECSPTEFKPLLDDLESIGTEYKGEGDIYGYAAIEMLVQLVNKAGSTDSTVIQEMANKGVTLPGIEKVAPPTTWPDYHNAPTPCASLVKIEGGKFVGVHPLECFETFAGK